VADPRRARSVYRYFDLADSFLRIRVTDADAMRLPEQAGLNRTTYRRLVIQVCIPELGEDVEASIAGLFPEDPLLVEDLLYQLCVEINPSLDIHQVRLAAREETAEERPARERREAPDSLRGNPLVRLRKRSRDLERRLGRAVIGQPRAIETVSRCVRRAAAGLASERRPLASLLFMGRTGTGKTELARVLARELFAREGSRELVRIDCSEYALAHEYAKLIGSPPGYVGHEQGGQLTEAMAANPECIVLFDEVEKAHPRIHSLLLQVLEEGELTDGRGRRVGFENALVILTANSGADEIARAARPLGFEQPRRIGRDALESISREALERRFAPELLGRLDAMVLFDELDDRAVERIAQTQLGQLAKRSRERGLAVAFTAAVARWVAERANASEHGAREIRHVIEREIEPLLADRMLHASTPARASSKGLLRVRIERGSLRLVDEP
jgi:ATP-dependent Clp protease ATP-binding subunit ClpA